ncbi:hypothetical protein AZE42_13864 [Rhizopogon vesiculosus]|uniref:Uncharacterized protein n=1 Tax=Rhizopogon vesiculosus TaxID=180088 RepID=A0A1J8RBU8_9AGAM|nr:hypothetical protein AZE42_13864 [Rhizopogon vesiculosus]
MSPMHQVPMDFISRSIPPFKTASFLHDCASGTLQDGNQSVIHPSFSSDPLPLLDVVPAGGAELEIIDKS